MLSASEIINALKVVKVFNNILVLLLALYSIKFILLQDKVIIAISLLLIMIVYRSFLNRFYTNKRLGNFVSEYNVSHSDKHTVKIATPIMLSSVILTTVTIIAAVISY